jgi:protein tyrosine/serine phosphatase
MTPLRFASLCLLAAPLFAADPGLPDFHQVDAHLSRGRQPTAEGFATLAKMGFKTVIDLRGGWLHMPKEKRLVEQAGMRYVEEQFSGIFPPRDKQIARLLAVMQDPAAGPVFVHCKRGADRAGLLIACYRMAHDHWSNQKAFDEALTLGLSRFEPLMRRYIRHFDAGRVNLPAAAPSTGGGSDQVLNRTGGVLGRRLLWGGMASCGGL